MSPTLRRSRRRSAGSLTRLAAAVGAGSLLATPVFAAPLPAAPAPQQSGPQTAAPVPANRTAPGTVQSQSGPVVLNGIVTDPDSAVIPGATITLTPASGKAYSATSGDDGSYALRGAPPGTYSLTITMPGFASYVRQGVRIGSVAQTVSAKLAIQDQTTVVNVTTNQNQVSVDQDSNASATVLKGKDLDALSDDPDELNDELTALAGPAAGPNGGQIYIDGFTGGQLPPKSSIREIRINQNPFSAEYDRAGFGRVEIFTKPGTDKLHGNFQVNGQDKSFNTGSPLITAGTPQPDYHTILGFGSLTGPLSKNASFAVNGSYRDIQDNSIVTPGGLYATSSDPNTLCQPGQAGCSTGYTPTSNAIFTPQTRWDISPRVDLALGAKNTLTTRFGYESNTANDQGIGGIALQSTGYSTNGTETTLQVSDSQILSAKVINETRFEFQRDTSTETPISTAPTLVAQGNFTAGGSSAGSSQDAQNHIEVQNYTSIALTHHFIRFGGRLRSTGETNTTTAGTNGTFTYNTLANYAAGNLSQYSHTTINTPTLSTRTTDLGLYAEDDWKIRPNLTFSYGLRYETQNFIHDHADFAPRLSVAYGITKKTVLRAGSGIFYDRFLLSPQFSVLRNNGANQVTSILTTPTGTYLPSTCTPANPAGCAAGTAGRATIYSIASNLRAPYTVQENLGVDQQLFNGATLSVNYQNIRGVHQFVSQVANYTSLGGSTSTVPYQYQYQSEGIFNQNQLIANVNYRSNRGISLFGFYVLNFAKSDTGGVSSFTSQPGNIGADYGRATFDVRNRVFLGGNAQLPHLISVSPFLIANSGTPYNITSGTDVNQDSIYNDRAVLVPLGTAGGTAADGSTQYVKTIAGCGTFATPGTAGIYTPAPINACTGPANFSLNIRVVKTIGFGARISKASAQQGDNGPRGGPGGGGPGGGGPRGGGRGGPGGPGGGGGASSGRRYNLALGFQGQNIFNIADRGTPIGVLTSNSFGQSTALAGRFFTTNSAVRRFVLQATFSF